MFNNPTPLMLITACALAACVPVPPQVTTTKVSYKIPAIDNTPDQPPERTVDGVYIAIVPKPFSVVRKTKTELNEVPTALVMNNRFFFEKIESPYVVVTPSDLSFSVKVTNKLDHVLRLAGSVLSIKVNGKRLAEAKGAGELLAATLAPGDTSEAELDLGPVESIPDAATIAIDLFDVPTVTDPAGNATKKAAFNWVYKLGRNVKEESGQVTKTEVSMTREEAASFR